jgi:hypothetical protein
MVRTFCRYLGRISSNPQSIAHREHVWEDARKAAENAITVRFVLLDEADRGR